MSNYFEEFNKMVSEWSKVCGRDSKKFLTGLIKLEEQLAKDCLRIAKDVDTPEIYRKKIIEVIILSSLKYVPGQELTNCLIQNTFHTSFLRASKLCQDLSVLFDKIADKEIITRYGTITNNPANVIRLMEYYNTQINIKG